MVVADFVLPQDNGQDEGLLKQDLVQNPMPMLVPPEPLANVPFVASHTNSSPQANPRALLRPQLLLHASFVDPSMVVEPCYHRIRPFRAAILDVAVVPVAQLVLSADASLAYLEQTLVVEVVAHLCAWDSQDLEDQS